MPSNTRHARFAAVLAVGATVAAGGAAYADAASADQVRPGAVVRTTAAMPVKHRSDPGFVPVKTLAASVIAMDAPARNELWLVQKDADAGVTMQHKSSNRWTTVRLPKKVTVDSWSSAVIHGTSKNDVWLTVGGDLFRFDGRRWRETATPGDAKATTVYVVDQRHVYVGLDGGVSRFDGRRWTSLGRPEPESGRPFSVRDIRVVDGTVVANWAYPQFSSAYREGAAVRVNGAWQMLYQTRFIGGGQYDHIGGWFVSKDRHLVLGSSSRDNVAPTWFRCRTWTADEGEKQCRTRWAVGAADATDDGRIVIGGDDTITWDGTKDVRNEGTFGVRTRNGVERVIGGDPGDKTRLLSVEPGTDRAWAVTEKGGVQTLQSWQG